MLQRLNMCAFTAPKLSTEYLLEWIAIAGAFFAIFAVFHSFLFGKHYIIPTIILAGAIILGNLGFYGLQDKSWARQVLFWLAVIISLHLCFGLFWAKTPRDYLGEGFVPMYVLGSLFFAIVAAIQLRSLLKVNIPTKNLAK